MNKHLLIILFVFISLLAIGTVSAADGDNVTDDSVLPVVSTDVSDELVVDEAGSTSPVEELEIVDEKPVVLKKLNQSADVLSEGNTNDKPSVTFDDITFESGKMILPLHVTNSDGKPLSGSAIVALYGEKDSIMKAIKLDNGNGQLNFTTDELAKVMTLNGMGNISDIYAIINSSINPNDVNISEIISGFEEIPEGITINMTTLFEGLNNLLNGNYVNTSQISDGIGIIEDSFSINVSAIEDGLDDIKNGFFFNSSAIEDGLDDIINAFSVNTSSIADGLDDIINAFTINTSSIKDGLDTIINAFAINRTLIEDGIMEILSGIEFNSSAIIQDIISDIPKFNLNIEKLNDTFRDIYDDINLRISDLLDNITQSISFNKSIISNELKSIFDELNITPDDLKNIDVDDLKNFTNDLMDCLNFTDNLQDRIFNILDSHELNLTEVFLVLNEIRDYNLTGQDFLDAVINISADSKFNVSHITHKLKESNFYVSNITDAFIGYLKSATIDKDFILDSINDAIDDFTADIPKMIDDIIDAAGIDLNKTSNVLQGFANILSEITFDKSSLESGFDMIASVFNLSTSDVIGIFDGISFNKTVSILKNITDDLKLPEIDVVGVLSDLVVYLKLNTTDDFSELVANIILGKGIDYMKVIPILKDLLDYNNLTVGDVVAALKNVTGSRFNISNIIDSDSMEKLTNDFRELFNSLRDDGVFTKLSDNIKNLILNNTNFTEGLEKISHAITFNKSAIESEFDKIFDELGWNKSDIIDDLSDVDGLNINISKIVSGLYTIASAFSYNESSIAEGIDMIYNSFEVDFSKIGEGIGKISESFEVNVSKISEGIDKISESFKVDVSKISEGIDKISESFKVDVSKINEGMDKIADSFDISGVLGNLTEIVNSFGYNDSNVMNAVGKIVKGLGVNLTNVVTQLMGDSGNGAVLAFILVPDDYTFPIIFKMPTQIESSKVSTTYGKSKEILINLKDITNKLLVGKEVSVKLNGQVYAGVTDGKGQLSILVPDNLDPKTYDAWITFAGDNEYGKSTESVEVVVSKATPKLVAKKKTFKRSVKVKKYAITLKSNGKALKKTKVTLKVKGKTYKAKTNKKGKATFKITKLNVKGKFKAVVKYKGNAFYKKVTKKVKITVK